MTEPGGENRRGRSDGAASHEFVADLLGSVAFPSQPTA